MDKLDALQSSIRRNSRPEESTIPLNLHQWTPDPANPKQQVLVPYSLKIPQMSVLSKLFDEFLVRGSPEELQALLAPAGTLSNNERNVALMMLKQIGEILVISGKTSWISS